MTESIATKKNDYRHHLEVAEGLLQDSHNATTFLLFANSKEKYVNDEEVLLYDWLIATATLRGVLHSAMAQVSERLHELGVELPSPAEMKHDSIAYMLANGLEMEVPQSALS